MDSVNYFIYDFYKNFMKQYQQSLYVILLNLNLRIIQKAYNLSKKVRKIHKEYIWYKKVLKKSSSMSWFNINMYMHYILNQYKWKMHFFLIIFKGLNSFTRLFFFNVIHEFKKEYDIFLNLSDRKKIWIYCTLKDLERFKENIFLFNISKDQIKKKDLIVLNQNRIDIATQNIPYEFIGLIPRSITRTLSRFQTELVGNSEYIILPEFRFAKFQAFTSLQYISYLFFLPWGVSNIIKIIIEPWVNSIWNAYNDQVFMSISQEQKALKELQNIEELLWLDVLLSPFSDLEIEKLSTQIYKNTINIVEIYNQQSIDTIINLIINVFYIGTLFILLILGKKRLSILNSWIQEVFYSLSDTMKSFFILLLTDLCIGFHSPHGWEILIQFILDSLGINNNKQILSCFVSTFPVVLDTVFKYLIFRHLNRISPSIVVNYHSMNE